MLEALFGPWGFPRALLEIPSPRPDDIIPGTTHGLPYVTCFARWPQKKQFSKRADPKVSGQPGKA